MRTKGYFVINFCLNFLDLFSYYINTFFGFQVVVIKLIVSTVIVTCCDFTRYFDGGLQSSVFCGPLVNSHMCIVEMKRHTLIRIFRGET